MEPNYEADLAFARDTFTNEIDRIAERVRKNIVIPVCVRYKLTYVAGNGEFIFSELNPPDDDAPRDFRTMDDVEAYGRDYDLREVFQVLNLEVMYNDYLGFHVADVRSEHLK